MEIQLLTKKGNNRKFVRIVMDTPNGDNPREIIALIPINDAIEEEILKNVREANYQSYAVNDRYCLDTKIIETGIFNGTYIKASENDT